jgi:hypothetical protein
MMHPYEGDTLLMIDIQSDNRAEILQCVEETFEYMPGWMMGGAALNAKSQNPEARFFVFNLTLHTFDWWRTNTSFADTMDEDDVVINNIADISHLLEFVFLNGDRLRKLPTISEEFEAYFGNPPVPATPSKKQRPPSGAETPVLPKLHKLNMSHVAQKLKEASDYVHKHTHSNSMFSPMDFIKIEEMPLPKAKVFYKDLSKKVACECPPPKPVHPAKHSWGYDEEMEALMAEKMKVYYEYCMEKKQKEAYDPQKKQWYGHESKQYEGIMIKSSPYNVFDDYGYGYHKYPVDTMDY